MAQATVIDILTVALAIIALTALAIVVVLIILVRHLVTMEKALLNAVQSAQDEFSRTMGQVQHATDAVSHVVHRLGAGAGYAMWVIQALTGIIGSRRPARDNSETTQIRPRSLFKTGLQLGVAAWKLVTAIKARKNRKSPPKAAAGD